MEEIALPLLTLPGRDRRCACAIDVTSTHLPLACRFEYAPDDAPAFDELVRKLRQTAEWGYVEREVDIRLVRFAP